MKIKRNILKYMTIEEFADEHALTMLICERTGFEDLRMRFYAQFEYSHILEGGTMLVGIYGNGPTEEAAIKQYAIEIDGKILSLNDFNSERSKLRLQVPHLTMPLPFFLSRTFLRG